MKKIKYEKPSSIDAGEIAAIRGASCSLGNLATDGCHVGNDPDVIPYCNTSGATATGNCWTYGGTAGQVCFQYGDYPVSAGCATGNHP